MYNTVRWILRHYRHYPHVLAILLLLTPLQVALQVVTPRLIGFTIEFLNTGTVATHWLAQLIHHAGARMGLGTTESFALGFIFLGLISHALYAYFQSWRAWMNLRLEWHFRQDAFDGITAKGPDFFNKFRTGDLVTRLTDDVAEKLSWFACSGIFRLYEAILAVIFIVLMMISIDPILTLWTAGPLPILIVIFFVSSSLLDKRYDSLQKHISTFNDVMEACFSGIRVVKAYVREKAQKKKFADAAIGRRQAEIDAIKVTVIINSLYDYIWQFGIVIVLIAGGYRVLYADLSMGDMATFIYYITWLVFPMFDIGQFLVRSRQSAVSIERLRELERVPPMVTDTAKDNNHGTIRGNLVLEHVSFSFPGSRRKILKDLNLQIPAGHTVAIVGKVGAGKSWLVNLFPRLVDPSDGSVKLDGVDLHEYPLGVLRQYIGYVPQEPVLFSDTVRNNIMFGRDDITEDVLAWAIDVSQFKKDIADFPKGLETPIGTFGMSISGGQKQRLGLARALVGKPRILILDDCTSALDAKTESALWERLHEVMPDLTAILITHRPDTLERVDNIFVLEDGHVIESGTHAELMKCEGRYAHIYRRYRLEEAVN